MRPQINDFKQHVRELSQNPGFVHHQWFVQWHLEIVERLALELCDHYPQADRDLVEVLSWIHDYGKIVDFDNQYMMTQTAGREKLVELGFPTDFVGKVIEMAKTIDKKLELDLRKAPIEAQIVSSADGCAHMTGPFYKIFWDENLDKNFAGRSLDDRNKGDLAKIEKDWKYKIVIPEARVAFQECYEALVVQCGKLPDKFFGEVRRT